MYSYIFNKYKSGHVALMGAMSTFRSRSILRELGKVYGLPKGEIDRLINEPEHMLNKNEVTNTILSVYNRMADFPQSAFNSCKWCPHFERLLGMLWSYGLPT
jgi:DNA polymerase-3 subunit alpha